MTPIRKSENKIQVKEKLNFLDDQERKFPYLPINFNNNNNKELTTLIRCANLLSLR